MLAGRRVLVIEDEYFIADDIARAIRQLGAEIVGPYPTLAEALATLDLPEPIDAAVVDIDLRGELAFQAADELLARGVPFVFSTGYDVTAVPTAYCNVPHWQKPFNPDALARALPSMLRASSIG